VAIMSSDVAASCNRQPMQRVWAPY